MTPVGRSVCRSGSTL